MNHKCCLPKTPLTTKSSGRPGLGRKNASPPSGFVSRDLAALNPERNQFSDETNLIPQHKQMAGMG